MKLRTFSKTSTTITVSGTSSRGENLMGEKSWLAGETISGDFIMVSQY
jgi:hypothetical protein